MRSCILKPTIVALNPSWMSSPLYPPRKASMSRKTPQPTSGDAPTVSPLFNDNDADVIIRTSDNVDFRVHKLILKRASSVFDDMFNVPTTVHAEEIQTVVVTEDGSTLTKLFQLCYPMSGPSFDNIQQIGKLLRVCDKYQMVDMMNRLAKLSLGAFMQSDPLQAYALACCARADEEVRKAAFYCLGKSLSEIINGGISGIPHITVPSYHALLKYHHACSRAAQETITSWTFSSWVKPTASTRTYCWLREKFDLYNNKHSNCPFTETKVDWDGASLRVYKWWEVYMKNIAETFSEAYPPSPVGPLHVRMALPPPPDCEYCKARYAEDLSIFLPQLKWRIDSQIAKVSNTIIYV
ncbi:hypothetical protein BDW22DRAFT_550945 [Trametopsis cervina]|nr:hypothetical protein BDW22DRAFT_550945 [Trametopsis cervina]